MDENLDFETNNFIRNKIPLRMMDVYPFETSIEK